MIAEVSALILAYRYWAILAISLFEAPLMSIIIGFFVATGDVDLYYAFALVVLGDFIGDTFLWVVGRRFRPLFERLGLKLNLSRARARKVIEYLGSRDRRAVVIAKLVHGIGFTGLIAAGSVRMPFVRFILTCVTVTVCQSAVLAGVGVLSGRAYQSYASLLGYVDAAVAAVALLALFLLYRRLVAAIGEEKPGE